MEVLLAQSLSSSFKKEIILKTPVLSAGVIKNDPIVSGGSQGKNFFCKIS